MSALPIDPTNTTSTGLYYTYTPGGSYEMTSQFESEKYASIAANDGGADPAQYEKGTDLTLSTFARGLAGYWKLDGNTNNSSGNENNGTAYGNLTYTTGKQGEAGNFDGVDAYVDLNQTYDTDYITISWWVKIPEGSYNEGIFSIYPTNTTSVDRVWGYHYSSGGYNGVSIASYNSVGQKQIIYPQTWIPLNEWIHLTYVRSDNGDAQALYLNGNIVNSTTIIATPSTPNNTITTLARAYPTLYGALFIDDVRIYNHVLSTSKISAIYNATK